MVTGLIKVAFCVLAVVVLVTITLGYLEGLSPDGGSWRDDDDYEEF